MYRARHKQEESLSTAQQCTHHILVKCEEMVTDRQTDRDRQTDADLLAFKSRCYTFGTVAGRVLVGSVLKPQHRTIAIKRRRVEQGQACVEWQHKRTAANQTQHSTVH